MLHNSLSRAAEENMLQACAPVGWHDDEIGRNCLRQPTNFIERRCAAEYIAGRGRDAAFTCHLLKLFERSLFSDLLIWHKGKWDHRRNRRHKIRSVIELMD